MNLLIISADPAMGTTLRAAIPAEEGSFVEIANADQVWDLIESDPAQIILVDWETAEKTCMEIVRRLHAANPEIFPYIILLLGEASDPLTSVSLGLIPGDWIKKPIQEETILNAIKVAERFLAVQSRLDNEQRQASVLAMRDTDTGILNRTGLYDRAMSELNRARREHTPLGLVLIQIDGLNAVEELHGAEMAVQLCQLVARTTKANIRSYDILGRWERGRFVFILVGITQDHLTQTANRIATSIRALSLLAKDGQRLRADTHLGATWMDSMRPEEFYNLVSQAEEALEQAIRVGNQLVGLYEG